MKKSTIRAFSVMFAAFAFFNFLTVALTSTVMGPLHLIIGAYFCFRSIQLWKESNEDS